MPEIVKNSRINSLSRVTLPPLLFGICVIAFWELWTIVTNSDPRLFPPPSAVAAALINDPYLFLRNAKTTAIEMVLGFGVGAIVGIALGLLVTYSKPLRRAVYPWLVISQTIPIPAVAAVLVTWFGFSILPKVIVVALIAFFPISVSTTDGLVSVDTEMIQLMRTFGANKVQIFREVRIPHALPHVFTGMKVAAAFSVLGAVFGEWVGARGGLGYLLLIKNRAVNTDDVFAIIAVLAALGVMFFGLISLIERLVAPWHFDNRIEDT
ncbi:MAG TPA: nitrate ABC transporter permease [Acidimicrobiaceae bacterium]|jgi:ABC-type nitrate/sulfonate/bicarbonate transport system permease component|nr:nitrate ABC transporter permease [Acidimicrobiaceae bacterium]|tara:strand:+ start:6703 stop:7500 length:798 start_codon:yes stop_codon:yes gene_type:complete